MTAIKHCLVLALVAVVACACTPQQASVKPDRRAAGPKTATSKDVFALERQAMQAYARGDWKSARENYEAFLSNIPTDTRAWLRLGNVYARLNRPQDAIGAYQRVLRRDPDNLKARHNLGLIQLREAGKTFSALRAYSDTDDPLHGRADFFSKEVSRLLAPGASSASAATTLPALVEQPVATQTIVTPAAARPSPSPTPAPEISVPTSRPPAVATANEPLATGPTKDPHDQATLEVDQEIATDLASKPVPKEVAVELSTPAETTPDRPLTDALEVDSAPLESLADEFSVPTAATSGAASADAPSQPTETAPLDAGIDHELTAPLSVDAAAEDLSPPAPVDSALVDELPVPAAGPAPRPVEELPAPTEPSPGEALADQLPAAATEAPAPETLADQLAAPAEQSPSATRVDQLPSPLEALAPETPAEQPPSATRVDPPPAVEVLPPETLANEVPEPAEQSPGAAGESATEEIRTTPPNTDSMADQLTNTVEQLPVNPMTAEPEVTTEELTGGPEQAEPPIPAEAITADAGTGKPLIETDLATEGGPAASTDDGQEIRRTVEAWRQRLRSAPATAAE